MALNSAQLIATGQLDGFRNRIINGDFRIWQRSTGPAGGGVGSGGRVYVAPDRFFKFNNGDAMERIDVSAVSIGGVTGRFNYACRISGNQSSRIIGQCIEGPMPSGQITVSAWVRFSSQPSSCYITTNSTAWSGPNAFNDWYAGTYSNNTYVNPDGWPGIYPGNNVWFKIQRTFTPITPEYGIGVGFQPVWSAAGTSTFDITGIQVEPGPVATDFDFRSYGQELALCQRYYEAGQVWSQFAGYVNVGGTNTGFRVTKRAVPTVTVSAGQAGNPVIVGPFLESFSWYNNGTATNVRTFFWNAAIEL